MPLLIDNFNKLILVTSPTTDVDAQTLHDFVEDYMASPVGMANDGVWPGFAGVGDIQKPEGKIEDPSQPGVFSQIIIILHPEWQIQFWGGSGYTRIFGGKLVGGISDQPMKATGTAGDITVLESPVDGLAIATGSGVTPQDIIDIADAVWDEILTGATHNISTSAGKRLRQLQESGSVYNGQVWVDTLNGTAGTELYVNGTSDNHVDSIADAKTISAGVGLADFHIINGSTIVLFEDTIHESYFGDNWSLDLGSQDVTGAHIEGATLSGIGTATEECSFDGCDVGNLSIQRGHFDVCGFSGTVTHTLAADYNYHNCYGKGDVAPIFTKTAGQTVVVEFVNFHGDITISGLEAGDTIELGGFYRTIVINGVDASVHVHGFYQQIIDNRPGTPDLNLTGAIQTNNIAEVWALLGLEAGNKITITPTGIDSEDGDIDIDLTGDGISSTIMDRQP